jgi:hypothetical protein
MQIDCSVLPRPMSVLDSLFTSSTVWKASRTVAENAMQLELGEKRHPADTLSLILAQRRVDLDRERVVIDSIAVQELREEVPLRVSLGDQVGGEALGIR